MLKIISKDINETKDTLDDILAIGTSFDILKREIEIAGKDGAIYYINGMCKEDLLEKIQEFFANLKPEDITNNIDKFVAQKVPFIEVDLRTGKEEIVTDILSGVICLVLDGFDSAIMMDVRQYPNRAISEPEKYRVLRGARDGFVETLVLNTSLIRRRIRSTDLRCEIVRAGANSRTDIAICYMDSRVDKNLLNKIKKQIKDIEADALLLGQESLAECLHKGSYFNPFPKFRYTERPDTTAAQILEGHIAIIVDTCPAAMLLPTTIFDVIEEADDYYFPPVTGTFLRLSRFLISIVSLLLTPLYLLFYNQPELMPEFLRFLNFSEESNIPLILQLLILEIGVDGLKLAAVNTPSMLNTPLSLIAAIVIGEFAINTGWFLPQSLLYTAVVVIANFTHENYEFAYAIKYCRMLTLILTHFFGVYGFIGGLLICASLIVFNRTLTNTSYIYPLYPFDGKELFKKFLRLKK